MSWKKLLVYFVAPLTVTLTLVVMYFSGVETLQQIVAPRIRGLSPTSSREFGLLENVQNLILLAMIAVCVWGAIRRKVAIERVALAGVALFGVFVFLEEIDYGLHWYEYAMDVPYTETKKVRNWHNQGDRTDMTKQAVDIAMVLFFVVAPFALMRVKTPIVRFFTADRYSALTLRAAFIGRTVAYTLEERGMGERGVIHQNLSEFRELITYYVFFLYLVEIAIGRTSFLRAPEENAE